MQVDILSQEGTTTGRKLDLPDEIFGTTPNTHVVYLAVKQYLATQRQGTHKVKTRKEVKGSSRKLHKQKGTGGSRKGNIRNPLYKGGGTIFGPKPRNYSFKLNKRVKDLAKVSVLSDKCQNKALLIVEDIKMEKPSTKSMVAIFKKLSLHNKKVLFITHPTEAESLYLSLRNLPSVKGLPFTHTNIYDMVDAEILLLQESAANLFVLKEEETDSEKNKI